MVPMSFTVLSFNILQLRFRGSRRRAQLALRAIEDAGADVVVLNEAFNRTSSKLVGRLRASGFHVSSYLGGFDGGWTATSGRRRGYRRMIGGGVYVASRFPIDAQFQHIYRAVAPGTTDSYLSNKGVLLVVLRVGATHVWVAGTHLQADEKGNRHAVRMAQLAELRAAVTALVPAGEPVILAGDLNVEYYAADGGPSAEWAQACRALGGFTGPEVMHDMTFDCVENPLAHGDSPSFRNVIDYIGVLDADDDPPALSVTTRTLHFPLTQEASDHFPLLATVTFHHR